MSREENARAAVQALIPDDEILDVALTYPRGFSKSQGVGMALGGAMGMGTDFQGVGLAIGGLAGGSVALGNVSSAIDKKVIDGVAVNGSAKLVDLAANLLRRTQSGFLYHYAFAMILGLIALLAVLMTYWR